MASEHEMSKSVELFDLDFATLKHFRAVSIQLSMSLERNYPSHHIPSSKEEYIGFMITFLMRKNLLYGL